MAGVDQWQALIAAELERAGYPLPGELVEAVMHRESRGRVGAINPSSGASGLMQVMPVALRDYNNNHKHKYTMADLRGKTQSAARVQVRVGLWVLARFWRGAFNYLKKRLGNVALDDLARVADMFYAAGPGNSKKKLDKVPRPTFDNIARRYPKWDRIVPAQRVWDYVSTAGGNWNITAIDDWLESGTLITKKKTAMGAAAGVLLIALALWYMQKGKRK